MGKIRVLIVDDHTILRQGVKALLDNQEGIQVVGEAQDGREALKITDEVKPDVILMDIAMPGLNGLEATRRIKRSLPDVKVLFLTVYGDYVGSALDAGANWYLTKDCRRQDLMEAIRVLARSTRAKVKNPTK